LWQPSAVSAYSPAWRRVEVASIGASACLFVASAPAVIAAGAWNVPGMLGTLLVADLVSGLVHWGCDTWGSPETPLVGPTLIRTFREHHVDPQSITRHDFVEQSGSNALGVLPFLAAALWLPAPVAAACVWFSVWIVFTNQVHAWAHGRAPRPVRWLQRRGLLLSPEHHAAHHRPPHVRNYCITLGWCNALLDRWRVWARMEALIARATGAVPRTG
jgi:plasmanylethanolamine desaturase